MKSILFLGLILAQVVHGNPAQRDTFRIAYFSQDVPGIDPLALSFDPDSYSVITQIFDSLVHDDLNGNIVPGLALGWEKKTPLSWEFQLRKNVKFHNGEVFDAHAVKFTFDFIMDPKNKTGNAWIFEGIERVEIDQKDPSIIRFFTKKPDGMFLNRFLLFGSICPPQYIKEKGIEHFHSFPVGTGPYRFSSWKKGESIHLEKNRNYWNAELPVIEKLVFKILPEESWANSLVQNEVDFVPNLRGNITSELAKKHSTQIEIKKKTVLSSYWVLTKDKGILSNLSVRKALNHAVDKNALIKFADFGNAIPQASLGKQGEFGANLNIQPYEYSPQKAKELVSPYPKIKLKGIADDNSRAIAKILKKNFEDIGIEVLLEIVPRAEVIKRVVQHKAQTGKMADYDFVVILVDNPIYHLGFHAGLFLHSASPWSLVHSEKFDEKFSVAMSETDPEKQIKLLRELDLYIHQNALMVFTAQKIMTSGLRREFEIDELDLSGHLDYEVLTRTRFRKKIKTRKSANEISQ